MLLLLRRSSGSFLSSCACVVHYPGAAALAASPFSSRKKKALKICIRTREDRGPGSWKHRDTETLCCALVLCCRASRIRGGVEVMHLRSKHRWYPFHNNSCCKSQWGKKHAHPWKVQKGSKMKNCGEIGRGPD